jgi:hypothetical protein
MLDATTRGGAHCKINENIFISLIIECSLNIITAKQAVFPGIKNWIWPETAFSETPDSNHI